MASLKANIVRARSESRSVQAKWDSKTAFKPANSSEYIESRHCVYKQREGAALIVERLVTPQSETELVVGANSRYGFRLKKNKDRAWILDELFLGKPEAATFGRQHVSDYVMGQVSVAFTGTCAVCQRSYNHTSRSGIGFLPAIPLGMFSLRLANPPCEGSGSIEFAYVLHGHSVLCVGKGSDELHPGRRERGV